MFYLCIPAAAHDPCGKTVSALPQQWRTNHLACRSILTDFLVWSSARGALFPDQNVQIHHDGQRIALKCPSSEIQILSTGPEKNSPSPVLIDFHEKNPPLPSCP